MNLKLPSQATVVLGLLAGLVTVLNTTSFGFGPPWTNGINVAVLAFAAFGISPLLGDKFRAALPLTLGETSVITGVLTFLQLLQTSEPIGSTWHAVIVGVLTVTAALGFGHDSIPVVKALRRRA